jgi:hypothetical protein
MRKNTYKVKLTHTLVRRTLLAATGWINDDQSA